MLEVVVEENAKRVETALCQEGCEAESYEGQKEVGAVLTNDLIDDLLSDRRKDNHHEGARYRAEEGGEGEKRVAPDIGENPDKDFHNIGTALPLQQGKDDFQRLGVEGMPPRAA